MLLYPLLLSFVFALFRRRDDTLASSITHKHYVFLSDLPNYGDSKHAMGFASGFPSIAPSLWMLSSSVNSSMEELCDTRLSFQHAPVFRDPR